MIFNNFLLTCTSWAAAVSTERYEKQLETVPALRAFGYKQGQGVCFLTVLFYFSGLYINFRHLYKQRRRRYGQKKKKIHWKEI